MTQKTSEMEKTRDAEWREIELRLLEEDIYDIKGFFTPIYVLLFSGLLGTVLLIYVASRGSWQQLFRLGLDGLAFVSITGGLVVMVESVLLSFYYTKMIVVSHRLAWEDLVGLVYYMFLASLIVASLVLFVYNVFSRLVSSNLAVSWTG
jgi:hypothetical protein